MARLDRRGAALLAAAMLCFAVSDLLAKAIGPAVSAASMSWVRYLLLLVSVLPVGARAAAWRSRRPGLHAGRACCLVASSVLFLLGIQRMPLAEATAMAFASPLYVTLLAVLFLGERVGWLRWLPVVIGFVGVLVVVRPGMPAFGGAEAYPMLSSLAWAVAVICTRRLANDAIATMMLYPAVAGALVLMPLLSVDDVGAIARHGWMIVAMGTSWCVAQWLTVLAYRTSAAATVAPFAYSQLVWATLLGAVVFGDAPSGHALAGIAIILSSAVLAAWLNRRPVGPRPVPPRGT